jgi:adenine-specific DNA-methyltransferase
MPTLHWIGKDKVINHHLNVPFRVLEHQYTYDNGTQKVSTQNESGNKIIHGDNLEALKALLPEYEGKIKCIYIDPPYNTGKDEWKYNDKMDDPKIQAWFDKIVGKEGEDLSRHDKWLCMMYPRVVLLQKLLKEDGVLFVSIDNNELFNLKLLLDSIFGIGNFLGNIIWKNATDNNPTQIADEHEYIVCYCKNKSLQPSEWKSKNLDVKEKLLKIGEEFIKKYPNQNERQSNYSKWFSNNKAFLWPFDRYKYIDEGGIYTGSQSVHNPGKEGYRYDIIHPKTKKPCKQPLMGYRFPETTVQNLLQKGKIIFGEDESKIIELKLYVEEYRAKLSSLIEIDGRKGAYELKSIFNEDKVPFKNPKTTDLLEEVLSFVALDNDIVLDSFAGSGTTAHAVLNLNKADGGNRKFIIIEMEDYAESITAERVKRVINGYADKEGTGGSFEFYELGKPIFLEDGNLNEAVGIERIRQYIYYTETQKAVETTQTQDNSYFLGKENDTSYYFYYGPQSITSLDHEFLASIKTKAEQYVIYADNCLLTKEFMAKYHIIFKKIPRDITRF